MSDKKLDLIAQMLAKAESTTPEEAEALTEHAERLMVKYGIEQAVIDARRAKEGKSHESIVEVKVPFTGLYRKQNREAACAVVFALGNLRPLLSERNNVSYMFLIGFEGDVEQAVLLLKSLEVQALIAMAQWWKTTRATDAWYARYAGEHEKRRARGDYLIGFGNGAAGRIRDNRATTVEEAGSGTELVLADRGVQIDAWLNNQYPSLRAGRASKRQTDYAAQSAGNKDGRNAATGERAMGQGSRAIGTGA